MNRLKILLAIAILFLNACVTTGGGSGSSGSMPTPTVSEYFRSEGAGFIMRPGMGYVQYGLSFKKLKPLPLGSTLSAEFENPSDPSTPMKIALSLKPETELIQAMSPQINAIQNKRNYRATIFVKSADGKVITEHTQYVRFEIPQGMESLFGIKLIAN